MPRPKLTEEQRRAAAAREERVFVEANPGSGKTTVAAERFGVLRFQSRLQPTSAVTAVSFTRSATAELRNRIRDRWGTSVIAWPHGVSTIDALLHSLLSHLLRTRAVSWPGGHAAIQVMDDWRGHSGFRFLRPGNYLRVCDLEGNGQVISKGVRVVGARFGFGNRQVFEDHLAQGLCTHEEVRSVLAAALSTPSLQESIETYLRTSLSRLVVDEVFDANGLDLELVKMAADAGIPVTLVGDPWQALYGFRGASPELVPELIETRGFTTFPLSTSFRFRTAVMQQLAADLRTGRPVRIESGHPQDVVLASTWERLWNGPEHVLPLSFGRITNRTDAIAIVLLDHLLQARFSERTVFLPEALLLLGLDNESYRTNRAQVLGNVIEILGRDGPERALRAMRDGVVTLGAPRRLRSGSGTTEQKQLNRLEALARRVRASRVVPGMTIHQAKGREWGHVGLSLTDDEVQTLASGLSQESENHRALYVALTRARLGTSLI